MEIWKEKNAAVLKLRDPTLVMDAMPEGMAVHLPREGGDIVVVKWDIETARVLKNLGIIHDKGTKSGTKRWASPIKEYYDFPGLYQPFEAQREAAAYMTLHPRAFNLSDMGTGKTLASLWAWDYLRSVGLTNKLLVVSPLSTLRLTWAREILMQMPHLNAVVLHGTKKKRLEILGDENANVFIINHDGVKLLLPELVARTDIDALIIDEISQCARNSKTARWKAMNKLQKGRKIVWGLTGTPTPTAPTDAWAQGQLVSPGSMPERFTKFREMTMNPRQMGSFTKWVPKDDAAATVARHLVPAIRFERADCTDLPPVMEQTIEVPMSGAQEKAYKRMEKHRVAEIETEKISASNAGALMIKLVQIAVGTPYSMDGETLEMDTKPRLEELRHVLDARQSKALVFAPFKGTVEVVCDWLNEQHKKARDEGMGNTYRGRIHTWGGQREAPQRDIHEVQGRDAGWRGRDRHHRGSTIHDVARPQPGRGQHDRVVCAHHERRIIRAGERKGQATGPGTHNEHHLSTGHPCGGEALRWTAEENRPARQHA